MICTGMCRVSGFCLSWLSTVQPSMSGRNTSSETAVGWYCLASSSASAPRIGDQHLEALVAREIDEDARIVRIVLDDQQDGIAGLDVEPVVRDLLDDAFLRSRQSAAQGPAAADGGERGRAAHRSGPTYFSGR